MIKILSKGIPCLTYLRVKKKCLSYINSRNPIKMNDYEKLIESKIQLHYKNTPKRYLNVRCYLK